ncbi:MAG: PepSY domain-containing protein [Treponema sp.]|nr:PepSY domain-containing protein [Treponema sp.]
MKRTKILALGLAITLAMAGTGIAFAQTGTKPAVAPTATTTSGEYNGEQSGDGEMAPSAENSDGESNDAVVVGTPAISYDQAVKAAEQYVKKGVATSAKLEDENGSLVYAVKIGGADIKVDAMTGAVIRVDGSDKGGDAENKD